MDKFGRYLRDNLVCTPNNETWNATFLLRICSKGGFGANGVWKDVESVYSGAKMGELYALLTEVNEFRNTRVAHVEVKLSNVDEAWTNMGKWVKCLFIINTMVF